MSGKISVRSRNFINAPFLSYNVMFQKHPANYIKACMGERYGRLIIIEDLGYYLKNGHKRPDHYVRCICSCGNIVEEVSFRKVKNGQTQSCGCLQKERTSVATKKHGLSSDKLYYIRNTMINRCYDKNLPKYKNYGARGIKVCDEWLNKENGFINFYNWAVDNGYQEGLTLERKDVNGNYCPENCCWIPAQEQAKNKTTTIYLTYKGETKTLADWARELNIDWGTLYYRYSKGWDSNKIIETPVRGRKELNENE